MVFGLTKYTFQELVVGLAVVLTAMPSRQAFAPPKKQLLLANAPPFASEVVETISVMNQCPPSAASYWHIGSPALLQPSPVSPITASSVVSLVSGASAALKTRISPMLIDS